MKTKIFVCSSSGINEIKHKNTIEAIPLIYKFSDDELFEDSLELSIEAVYNRLRYEKNSNLDLLNIGHERISEYLVKAIEDGYDNAFFILPNRSVVNLSIPVKIALEENKDINVAMYQSTETSIPLAMLAMYADMRFEEGASVLEVWNELVAYENISNIFIFTPSITKEQSANFEKSFKKGTYHIFKDGKLMPTPDIKKNNALEIMINEFSEEIEDKEIIPFVLTTDKSSKYNEIIINSLKEIENDLNKKALDKVRIFNLPVPFGIRCGINSIAIGYIEAKKGFILEKK